MSLPRALFRVGLGALGFLLTVPAFAVPRFVAPAGVDAANLCASSGSPCATVQHAVDVALPGDSIEIAPAIYDQRLRVESKTNLTFHAAGVTLRPDPAVLGPADAAQGSPCSGSSGRAFVFVRDSSGIVFDGLSVDGSAALPAANEPNRLVGIFYRDASGAINGGGVAHLHTVPASSNQVAGLGILIQTDSPVLLPPRVDITGVTVTDFQKSGIVFSGCDCAADGGPTGSVRKSTVTSEPSPLVGRNGIQVSFGAGSVVLEDNLVSDVRFTGADTSLGLGSAVVLASSRGNQITHNVLRNANFGISNTGDLFCAPREGENLGNEIRCNQILGNDIGISLDNNTHTIKDNDFSGNTQFAILTRDYYPAGESDADATNNWWGSPTGPTIASNPGGTGDPLDDRVAYRPFLAAPSLCAQVDGVVAVPTVSGVGLAALAFLLGGIAVLRLRRRV